MAWVVCDGLPVCIATDKLRPCTAAELLAYQYMHDQCPKLPMIHSDSPVQQSFIDEREFSSKKGKHNQSQRKGVQKTVVKPKAKEKKIKGPAEDTGH